MLIDLPLYRVRDIHVRPLLHRMVQNQGRTSKEATHIHHDWRSIRFVYWDVRSG